MMVKKLAKTVPIRNVINGLTFYLVWFVCVANGANGGLLYIPLVLGALGLHYMLSQKWLLDTWTLLFVFVVGACVDTFYMQVGMVQFTTPNPLIPSIVPFWILGIYSLFATSLNAALIWLQGRPLLAAAFGFGGGIVSYAYGERVGAVTFLWGYLPTLLIIGVVWAGLLPFFYWVIGFIKSATSLQDR